MSDTVQPAKQRSCRNLKSSVTSNDWTATRLALGTEERVTSMTFEEWMKRSAWHVTDEWVLSMMQCAFNAGKTHGKKQATERTSKMNKRRYEMWTRNNICPRCKRKHDAETVYCDACKVVHKLLKAAREARKCRQSNIANVDHGTNAGNVADRAKSLPNAKRAD